eukprot:TRINITY_DN13398_c0_g1_i1.p1 TRINITY_DN13398_c0_g1~~TRINITY_DN13398_c0_g1_i1.p1  ORF type:complete len:257 (+),score=46.26 TRINITY_DN13398_c0_g1_i1:96-866(+)
MGACRNALKEELRRLQRRSTAQKGNQRRWIERSVLCPKGSDCGYEVATEQWSADENEDFEVVDLCHQAEDEFREDSGALPNFAEDCPEAQALSPGLCAGLAAVYDALVRLMEEPAQKLSRFHSAREPPVGIEAYMARMQKYFHCSDACHITALVYIDRIVKLQGEVPVTKLTIHRLLATATIISAKFLDDSFYTNSHYAKVCGMSLRELNCLEAHLLGLLNFRLAVTPEEYAIYFTQVRRAVQGAAEDKSTWQLPH